VTRLIAEMMATMANIGVDAMLESNGDSFADVAAQRGVDPEQAFNRGLWTPVRSNTRVPIRTTVRGEG
jgi:hypothetical protein